MTNRVHIDAPAGVIDLEGDKEFVERLLEKLFPLVEGAGFGSRPMPAITNGANNPIPPGVPLADSEDGKARTRTGSVKRKPPAGQSCSARILALRNEGFFLDQRRPAEIVAKLAERRQTHNTSQVSAAAGDLVKRGELQRIRNSDGSFVYYWDRG